MNNDIWAHCFTFLGLKDFTRLARCGRKMNIISKQSYTLDRFVIGNETDLARVAKYKPRKLGCHYIDDLSALTSLRALSLFAWKGSLTSLTNLTHLHFEQNALYEREHAHLLPPLKFISCQGIDFCPPGLESLTILNAGQLPDFTKFTSLRSLQLELVPSPKEFPPFITELYISANDMEWIKTFSPKKITTLDAIFVLSDMKDFYEHLPKLSVNNLRLDLTIDTMQPLIIPDTFMKNIVALTLIDASDINYIWQLTNLEYLNITTGENKLVTVKPKQSRFYHWPNMWCLNLACPDEIVKRFLHAIHNSKDTQKNYTIQISKYRIGLLDYICDMGMQETFIYTR